MRTLIFLLIFIAPVTGFTQVIKPNKVELGLGVGFGIYGASDNNPDSESNMAGAGILNFSLHYTLSDRLSLGVVADRNGFITNKDSANNKGVSYNYGLDIVFRLIGKSKTIIYVNFLTGLSNFRYDDLTYESWVKGNGLTLQPGLGFKHYFSNTFGIFIHSSYAEYPYNKLINDAGEVIKTGPPEDLKNYKIKLSGLNLKVGLTFNI